MRNRQVENDTGIPLLPGMKTQFENFYINLKSTDGACNFITCRELKQNNRRLKLQRIRYIK